MALLNLNLYVDVDGKSLVSGPASNESATLPVMLQGDTIGLAIYLLRRSENYDTPMAGSPFTPIAPIGISLRVGIGVPSSDDEGDAPPIYQTEFTADPANGRYTGSLHINRAAVETLLNGALEKVLTFEIEANDGDSLSTIFYGPVTVRGDLLKDSVPSEPPPVNDRFLTLAEAMSLFVRQYGTNSFTMLNENNTWATTVSTDQDGELKIGKRAAD